MKVPCISHECDTCMHWFSEGTLYTVHEYDTCVNWLNWRYPVLYTNVMHGCLDWVKVPWIRYVCTSAVSRIHFRFRWIRVFGRLIRTGFGWARETRNRQNTPGVQVPGMRVLESGTRIRQNFGWVAVGSIKNPLFHLCVTVILKIIILKLNIHAMIFMAYIVNNKKDRLLN